MKVVPLSSVLSAQPRNGWSPPAEFQTGTGVPVLTLSSVTGFEYDGTRVKLTSAPTEDDAHYWLKEGELLITRSNTQELVGHAAIYDGTPSRAICCDLIMKMQVDPRKASTRFIHFYLQSPDARSYLTSRAHGASSTMKKIGKEVVQNIPIPLVPLDEQQRIVGILDQAFESIATARVNAEKNLQNANAFFTCSLGKIIHADRHGWRRAYLEDLCDSIMDCVNKTAPQVEEPTPFKMIRTTNIRNGHVNTDSVNYVAEETYQLWTRRQIPQEGDVLLTREAPMGEVGIIETKEKVFLGQRIVSYRANPKILNNRFLLYALMSNDIQKQIRLLASGTTVQHMRVPDSKRLQISLPSLNEQASVVALLDELRESTRSLASIYQRKLAALDELKKSLLHHAFTGQL